MARSRRSRSPALTLETERLRLAAFDPRWLLALLESTDRFAEVSGLQAGEGLRDFFVSGEVSEAFLEHLRAAGDVDPWAYGYAVALRGSPAVIGTAGFKGPPDEAGVVEIAYGIVPSHEGRGYATEVAAGLGALASADARLLVLRAHTLPEANASTRVLAKAGYAFVGEVMDPEDGRVWRWERGPVAPGI